MSDEKIVLPGEQISTSEESLPGEGTFEDRGIIKASRMGQVQINKKDKSIIVKPVTSTPVMLKKGDTVICEVRIMRSSMAIVEAVYVPNKNRGISSDTNGTIHVSEISENYVKDASSEYGSGDIIRARVMQVTPSLQLSTKGTNLGAIKSLCTKCRKPLKLMKGNLLECENCSHKETRKIASDYGQGNLNKI